MHLGQPQPAWLNNTRAVCSSYVHRRVPDSYVDGTSSTPSTAPGGMPGCGTSRCCSS
jgi:hypothetical protein